jgi:hypothetical protein
MFEIKKFYEDLGVDTLETMFGLLIDAIKCFL